MALVAEAERAAITHRTTEALAFGKARGTRLRNLNGAERLRRADKDTTALRTDVAANAATFARDLASVLADIRAKGHTTLRLIAIEHSRRGR